jgi:tripartite-type tricarboxylate transporter receptor subunit TctC
MNVMRILLCAVIVLSVGTPAEASSKAYPSRPITLIVPFAAGGPTDTIALALAEGMGRFLGQPVVPENITGAAGTIAVGRTVQAPPDGYTIGIGHWSTHVLNGAIYALPYSLVTDLQPIAMVTANPQLIIGKGALPAQDLRQLISWLKANPDKALQGTAGTGSPSHVAGVYFQKATDTRFQFVPYRGGAPAMQALLAGQMDLGFEQAANVVPHLRSGIIKAYAVTSNSRLPAAPEVPTVEEAGLAGFYVSVWHGLWAPKGTPKEVIATLNNAVARALHEPTVRQRLTDLGQEIPLEAQQTPEALAALQKAEIGKWWPIVKAAGIKAE